MPKGIYKDHSKMLGNKHRVGKIPWNKGKKGVQKASEETKRKLRLVRIGNKNNPGLKGKDSPNWKGGKCSFTMLIRSSYKYRLWRSDVYTRDRFTCQECYQVGGKLNVHHIKSFSQIIEDNNINSLVEGLNCEELWNINNGQTLCDICHRKTDNYARKRKKGSK